MDVDSILEADEQREEAHLTVILKTFIPAFIWAYNELKSAILRDETCIRESREEINKQKRALKRSTNESLDLDEIENPPSAASRFGVGTALKFRKQELWKGWFNDTMKNNDASDWTYLQRREGSRGGRGSDPASVKREYEETCSRGPCR